MMDTVIVAGGSCDLLLHRELLNDAYLIGADRGALTLADSGYKVDLAVGDFDSVTEVELERIFRSAGEVDKLETEKDETDLEHAIKRAIKMTAGTVHILGATGTRLDQTISAINLLKLLHDNGREAYIYDRNNRIRLIEGHAELAKGPRRYVSLIPYGDIMVNVSLKGFKYSGDHITLERKSSLGISNEIVDDVAEINCRGYLFVFESED
ncbi:MAG: thiamine diphosphokinase [Lachnospiraceae bacterium]|nr:thiamine diphosphokinase [Lachnospiraceae bacterium]